MYRAAVLSKNSVNRLSFSLDENVISLKIDGLSQNTVYKLKNADEEIIPNQRVSGDQLLLELPKFTIRSGFYELRDDNEAKAVLAFNNTKSESRLEQMTTKEENWGSVRWCFKPGYF